MTPILFAGTPEFAAPALQALHEHPDYTVVAVLTQPDRPRGRGRKLQASAVKCYAESVGLPVYQPEKLKDDAQNHILELIAAHNIRLAVVAAYGLIIPAALLAALPLGWINIHASLLPRWRGAAPIQRAIAAGDLETGISIMRMERGLDTGAVWRQARCSIEHHNAAELSAVLAKLGARTLLETLALIEQGSLHATAQDETLACYAEKLNKEEGHIDWHDSAVNIERCIRAFNPYPVAYSFLNGERLRWLSARVHDDAPAQVAAGSILRHDKYGLLVQCGAGQLLIDTLQRSGKKPAHAADLANGAPLQGLLQ